MINTVSWEEVYYKQDIEEAYYTFRANLSSNKWLPLINQEENNVLLKGKLWINEGLKEACCVKDQTLQEMCIEFKHSDHFEFQDVYDPVIIQCCCF